MSERVLAEVVDGVFTLTLNRPDKRNAMDAAMIASLTEALTQADLDAEVRVVAVRGAGPDFCAGADLAELLASVDRPPGENAADAARLGEIFIRMRRLPKPVVAVVEGRALAGGCGLATACDIVLAHEEAVFGYPEIRRGFVPAMVMAMLVRTAGEKAAFDLVSTGRNLAAREAQAVGLVSRVLPAAGFHDAVHRALAALATASGSALSLIKQELYALEGREFEEAIRLGAEVNGVARSTEDFRAAVTAFLDRS